MEEQKAKLKQLILDAEALIGSAKAEARHIVRSAEIQAKELVQAARSLHDAAEHEAAQLRAEAERMRGQAEAEAQRLAEDAHARHRAAIEEARVVAAPGQDLSSERSFASAEETDAAAVEPDDLLRQASERADQILRVARSEASARSEELLEAARRRAAQIDEDARRREEVAAKQFRQIKRAMQDEQLDLKSRIAELKAELRAVESELGHHAPSTAHTDEANTSVERPETPVAPREPSLTEPAPGDTSDIESDGVLASRLAALEAAEGGLERSPDDYAQAMKRFRRRA